MFRATLLAVLLVFSSTVIADEDSSEAETPVVYEHYDAVALCIPTPDLDHCPKRVLFIRGGKIIANRYFGMQDMFISHEPDGKFCIEWNDYWRCDRRITFDEMIVIEHDWVEPGQGADWFGQARVMTDLKEP